MSRNLLRLALLASLLGGCAPPAPPGPADILLGPYVIDVTDTTARVQWVTDPNVRECRFAATGVRSANPEAARVSRSESLPVKVEVTTHPLPDAEDTLHVAALSGLKPNQTYRYAVSDSNGRTEGFFRTAPAKDSRVPLKFIVYGDTRSYPERHQAVADAMLREMPFSFVLHTGDLVSNGLMWHLWEDEFFDPARGLLRRAAIWPVRGNHEGDAVTYGALFGLPNEGLYYSFDYGDAHFVVLDSGDGDAEPDPKMLAWLEKDLAAAAQAQWLFAVYHKPTVDAAGYGQSWGRGDVWPLLQKHGVDIIFSGHSHVYERFRPIGAEGAKPIIQIVAGGGGAPNYQIEPNPALEAGYEGLHYCAVELAGDTLQMTVKTPGGQVIDRFRLRKTAGRFDKETMDRALTTPKAWEMVRAAALETSGR